MSRTLGRVISGESWRLGHRPVLDGLRGVAVLLVLVSHGTPNSFLGPAGPVGVTIFFVLSGFLITTLLIEERDQEGRIDFAKFYARRARRLLPALFAMVATVTVIGTMVDGFVTPGGVVAALFYFANIAKANGSGALGALGHTWSLSIEEQFYLVWPLVLVAVARWGRRAIAAAAIVGIVGSVLFRFLAWDGTGSYYSVTYSSFSHADGLLLGCLLAVAMPTIWQARLVVPPVLLLLGGVVAWCAADPGWWRAVVEPSGVAVLTVGLIVAALRRPGWLDHRLLRWCGRRSYGLYLWHYPVGALALACMPDMVWWARAVVVLMVTTAVAEVSWRFVEEPFRCGRRARVVGASVAVPVVGQ